MREIKFRGFSISRKQWVYGYYNYTFERGYWSQGYDDVPPRCYYIDTDTNYYEVYSQSVGQYTGLNDKNGKEIYEGDIIQYDFMKAKIIYGYCGFELEWLTPRVATIRNRKNEPIFSNISLMFEVIGNIYENLELLD